MIPSIFEERLLYYRERAAGAYSAGAYCVASVAAVSPLTALNSFVFCAVLYPLAQVILMDLNNNAEP